MQKLCAKTLKIDNATFLAGSEYEVSLHPHITGALLVTDDRGITTVIAMSLFNKHFI